MLSKVQKCLAMLSNAQTLPIGAKGSQAKAVPRAAADYVRQLKIINTHLSSDSKFLLRLIKRITFITIIKLIVMAIMTGMARNHMESPVSIQQLDRYTIHTVSIYNPLVDICKLCTVTAKRIHTPCFPQVQIWLKR